MAALGFHVTSDPHEAQAWFAGLVAREPDAMSVVASVTESLVRDPSRYASPRWWAGHDGDDVVAAAMHTPPHILHIALATAEQARTLAAVLAAQGDELPGVGGLRTPAEAFAAEWAARTGARPRVRMQIGRFDLPVRPEVPFAVPGAYRQATEADLGLVDAWHEDFVDAIEGSGRRAPSLAAHVADGRVGLWVDPAGEAVSMAYASPASGGVTRIAGVWTPTQQRRHGYASAVVAALSTERLAAGESCMLYTDLANATTTTGIYCAIGYQRIEGDAVSIKFS